MPGTGRVYLMPDCIGRRFIEEEVTFISSEDRWPGSRAQFPSCVNLAKSVRLKFFSFPALTRIYIHTSLQV